MQVGGIEYLAGLVERKQQENPNTTVVSAGDLIGASPLLSALFHDEPTIEAMNILGLELDAVGNHEFDEGAAELLRMQDGGCHPVDGCQDGDGFGGADFRFLAANVVREDTGRTIFPAYAIKRYRGARIGFIGLTLTQTPEIVTPSRVAGLRFVDEATAINDAAAEIRRRGVETIVVLLHQGGNHTGFGINDCDGVAEPIRSIVARTTPEVDLFLTGHTHQAYNCTIDGRPVTSAASNGRLISDIDLSMDDRFLYVACWGTGELRQYDVTDPFKPTLSGNVRIGGIGAREKHRNGRAFGGGPQMTEISRDGRRVFFTNSLYSTWDRQFYPDGVPGVQAMCRATPQGGLELDPDFYVEFGDGYGAHQVRLQGGDCSTDSFCYPSA